MRIFKTSPVLTIVNSYLVDSPQPSTLSYLWNFGSLLGLCLVAQIISGILLAMHYQGSASFAFISVEHIMRDVNDGWLIRMCHANIASFFFIAVYLHISRGLYYGSYRSPRIGAWVIGTIIFFLMMATAFLGYVLPYGQMSLWGIEEKMPQMYNLELIIFGIVFIAIINLTTNVVVNKSKGIYRIGPHNKDILSIIYGSLLGDVYAEKRISGVGTRICFFQEDIHLKYILYLHNLLSKAGYCNDKLPIVRKRLGIRGKIRKIARFSTWTYTSFNWIYEEWYINGKKCVPKSIDGYLTPLALAVWIMDDGSKIGKGLKFSTNSFTYNECIYLVYVLHKKFNLKASVQSAGCKDQYIIYIWKQSMDDLFKIVSPYIIPEMKYKII